jgi:hypothetical protein
MSDTTRSFARADWIVMPAVCLLTIALVAGSTELAARRLFVQSATKAIDCMILNDASTGVRAVPNSVCSEKLAEGLEPIEYRFNGCGHRAGIECGPKPPGVYRVVMIGSSFAMGLEVSREQSFAATLPGDLSARTGRRIELYNEGMESGFPHSVELRFDEALAAEPDLILWILTPFDIKKVSSVLPDQTPARSGFVSRNWSRLKEDYSTESLSGALAGLWGRSVAAFGDTRTALMLRHVLFQNQAQYVKSYLISGDDESGFLEAELSDLWRNRLRLFDGYASRIEERARQANIPMVAVMLPNRAQAALIAMGEWPKGVDPYELDRNIRAVIASHGETYVDILSDYRGVPAPEQGYFAVDGHPNAQGHALMSMFLAKELTNGGVPALKAASR